MPSLRARVGRSALPLILLLAAILRLLALARPLWYDEAFAVLFAEKGLGPMLYGTLTPVNGGAADIHPLLYYLTLDGWMKLFGESPAAVRALSVVFSVATVGVLYLLGRDLFDRRTGLAAALIVALAPFAIQYGTEARMYSLLGLLLSAATWCFVRGEREPAPALLAGRARRWWHRWRWWVGFGALAALAMNTQQLAAFYLLALGLIPLLRRKRRPALGVLLGAGVALILYLPWLTQLPGQVAKVGSYYWIAPPNVARFLLTLRQFLFVGLDVPLQIALATVAAALIIFLLLIIQAIMTFRRPRRADRPALAFTLWLFAAPVGLMWLVSQARPVYLERALFPSALMLYLALGWLFTRGGLPGPIARVVGVLALVIALVGCSLLATWHQFPNSDYPRAAALLWSGWEPDTVIVHQSKLSALPMIYYARDLPQHFLADAPGSPEDTLALPTQQTLGVRADACLQSAAYGAERVYFVVYGDLIRQAQQFGRADIKAALGWLNAHYRQENIAAFDGDLNVILYDTPDAVARAAHDCETSDE